MVGIDPVLPETQYTVGSVDRGNKSRLKLMKGPYTQKRVLIKAS